jgi:hypothetical protein
VPANFIENAVDKYRVEWWFNGMGDIIYVINFLSSNRVKSAFRHVINHTMSALVWKASFK